MIAIRIQLTEEQTSPAQRKGPATTGPSVNKTMSNDSMDNITGDAIAESYRTMREVDNRIRERNPSQCLIRRDSGCGRASVDCRRDTQWSHTIQEAVLKRIASGNPPSVITFMPIATELLANASKAGNGELWSTLPWDLDSLPLKREIVGTASTSTHPPTNS